MRRTKVIRTGVLWKQEETEDETNFLKEHLPSCYDDRHRIALTSRLGPVSIESSAVLHVMLDSIWIVGEICLRTGTGKAHNSQLTDGMHALLLLPSNGECHASLVSITAELNKGYM
jgi:hypothetical protein